MRKLSIIAVIVLLLAGIAAAVWTLTHRRENATVADRLAQYGPAARARLRPLFPVYPPTQLTIVGLKHEKRLQLYAATGKDESKFIREYPILAASGTIGPKLREGDRQVPEGLYRIESLNPNSRFHLSLRINYPNQADRNVAEREGRTKLGGDIMIHGNRVSVGCLAVGDQAAEDLFVLAADTGLQNIEVILSPVDFRVRSLPRDIPPPPGWMTYRYRLIAGALDRLPSPK